MPFAGNDWQSGNHPDGPSQVLNVLKRRKPERGNLEDRHGEKSPWPFEMGLSSETLWEADKPSEGSAVLRSRAGRNQLGNNTSSS